MLTKICLLILLQSCLLMNSIFAASITITMAPEVSIQGPFMTLGQVADISGDDHTLIEKLQQFKLGNAPLPGSNVVLTKELLIMRLGSMNYNFNDIIWQIPEAVKVTTVSQTISGQVLLAKAILAIQQQAGAGHSVHSGELSITPIGSIRDLVIPVGDFVLASTLPYGIHYNSPTSVTITVSVNGQAASKISLRLNTKLYQQVVVTTSRISPGEILTTDKLHYERTDTGRLGAGYFTDINKVQGLVARRPLAQGIVVTEAVINKPVLIKQGNIVNIVARIGSMEVSAAGHAMQDGSEGGLIRVKNINSTKIIFAKVLDASTVQVLTYKSNGV